MTGKLTDFRRRLLAWYSKNRRDLPWRVTPSSTKGSLPDPYHVLLSEAMLQQTQVATVIPYFHRFIERFPTLADLAAADLQDVLRLWQGLGYYSRARNLHACAKKIVADHAGVVPSDPVQLLELPGIGRYTAGAIASLAFDQRAPILDGNVTRVLCRLDQIETDPRQKEIQTRLWTRATEILPARRSGDFNSALMELGATLCLPRNPQCLLCPVRAHCQAHVAGLQDRIPLPKKSKAIPLLRRHVFCIRHDGKYLIEQRPEKGRWAGMWQFKTLDLNGDSPKSFAEHLNFKTTRAVHLGTISHTLTHRRYEFEVYKCDLSSIPHADHTWVTLADLDLYPLPKPHVEIARMLAEQRGRVNRSTKRLHTSS